MKRFVIIFLLSILCIFTYFRQSNKNHYDLINAVSGATPVAVARDVPDQFDLTVDGMVKREYQFSGSALGGFAPTRIRVAEYRPDGEFTGAYIYLGIPVFNILEGVAPEKPQDSPFDQPVDLAVRFTSSSGATVKFSYNEILMTDDQHPITLAYYRQPIIPTNEKVQEQYDLNKFTDELTGLRLIAPKESTTRRYLDDVVKITLHTLDLPDAQLPVRDKKMECSSYQITCVDSSNVLPGRIDDVPRISYAQWPMIGHGHGYEKTVSLEGYSLQSFLMTNFPNANPDDFYLFVSCDGYRCLFSGHEIFRTGDGAEMLIADMMDDNPTRRGYRLAAPADFFADRSMWGLSHVVRIAE